MLKHVKTSMSIVKKKCKKKDVTGTEHIPTWAIMDIIP